MYLLVLSKDIEVLGSLITKREIVTLDSLDALKPECSWYKTNGWKLQSVWKAEWGTPYEAEKKVLDFFKEE